MVIGNVELMYKCFPKHSRMLTARMKEDKETDKEGKERRVSMERSKAGTKKRSPDCRSLIKIQQYKYNIAVFYKI